MSYATAYVPDSAPAWGASVRNGSELPVYQIHVEFVPIERWQGVNVVIFEVIPPGEWLVSGRKLYLNSEPAPLGPHLWDMPERTFVIELGFTDTNGQSWHRSSGGVLVGPVNGLGIRGAIAKRSRTRHDRPGDASSREGVSARRFLMASRSLALFRLSRPLGFASRSEGRITTRRSPLAGIRSSLRAS